jgi:hypothetical protein
MVQAKTHLHLSANCSVTLSLLGLVPVYACHFIDSDKKPFAPTMSVSLATYNAHHGGCFNTEPTLLHAPYQHQSSRTSMLSSLKKKLSRRSSNPQNDPTWGGVNTSSTSPTTSKSLGPRSGGLAPPQDNNPFSSSSSPATRRPSKLITKTCYINMLF